MKTPLTYALMAALFMILLPRSGSGQDADLKGLADSARFFIYVDYCGLRYNQSLRKHEMILRAVFVPIELLKKMPRLKDNGLWSARNSRISKRQQAFLKSANGELVTIPIDKYRYYAFYPQGLRKGVIVEAREFIQWDFLEPPASECPPVQKRPPSFYPTWYRFFWDQFGPVIIRYT